MTGSQIKKALSEIIDSLIIDDNESVTDDMQVELLMDGDEREEAIKTLLRMIEFYREDL